MKVFVRSFIVLLAFTISASAQKPTADGHIESRYDRFEDRTTVDLTLLARERAGASLVISISGDYVGAVKPPGRLILVVQSIAQEDFADWSDAEFLNVIADGQRFKLQLSSPGTGQRSMDGRLFVNTLAGWIDYADFRTIARAKSVEMRFAGTEFALNDTQLGGFRGLLKMFHDLDDR